MRIIANKRITHRELFEAEQNNYPVKDWIRHDLANAVAGKIFEINPLFYEEDEKERAYKEFRMELIVISKETFNKIILTLQENDVRKTVREKIRELLINSL
jgi:hypothetical protein